MLRKILNFFRTIFIILCLLFFTNNVFALKLNLNLKDAIDKVTDEIENKLNDEDNLVNVESETQLTDKNLIIEIDEDISKVKIQDLKKLKTRDMEKVLFGTVSLGFYENGDTFIDTHHLNKSNEEGQYESKINDDQNFNGVYKIVQSKICYLLNGVDDWQCAWLYKSKKQKDIYYWAIKDKVFAKIVNILDISKYELVKSNTSNVKENSEETVVAKKNQEDNKKNTEEVKEEVKNTEEDTKVKVEEKVLVNKTGINNSILPEPPKTIDEGASDSAGLKGKGIYCQDKDLFLYIDFKGVDEKVNNVQSGSPKIDEYTQYDNGRVDLYWIKRTPEYTRVELEIANSQLDEIIDDLIKTHGENYFYNGRIKQTIFYYKYTFNKKTTNYSKEYKPGFIAIDSWLTAGLRKEAWINIDRTNLNVKWQNRISGWHNIYNPMNHNNMTFNQNINSTYYISQSGSPAKRLFNWDRLNEFHYVESKILDFFYEQDNTYIPDVHANLTCKIERKNESEITSYFKKVSNILNQDIKADIKKIKDTISEMKPKTLL